MAKARSRRGRGGMRRRKRADWVYRNDIYIDETQVSLGGYAGVTENGSNLTAGAGSAQALILLDSQHVLRAYSLYDQMQNPNVQSGLLPAAARPEYNRQPVVKCVEGWMLFRASTWTLGTRMGVAMRLGWYEQDLDTGQLSLDVDYGVMDVALTEAQRGPSICANDYATNIKSWYFARQATDNGPQLNVPVFWKGSRRAPSEKHCLALYLEGFDWGSYAPVYFRRMVRALITT